MAPINQIHFNASTRVCIVAYYGERARPLGYAVTHGGKDGGYFYPGTSPDLYRTRRAAKQAALAYYGDSIPVVNVYNVC